MAQINEYSPQAEAQGAVGGVTPNLEAVSLFGRGVEHVGTSLEEAGNVVHRREAQQEISQVYGQFAQARADWNIKLKQGLRDGSLDPDKLDQQYADYVNKAGEGIQTAEGKDFFNRQANRLGGTLMQNAVIGKAQIAGEQAFNAVSEGVNVHVANLMNHPNDAPDALDATVEMIDQQHKQGVIDTVQAMRLRKQLLPQIAEAAIKGYANMDPGQNPKGEDNENVGKQALDNGMFAEHLNEQQRSALYTYARQQDNLRRIDNDRQDTTAHRLLQKQGLDYMDQNMNRVLNGSYSAKEIESSPMTAEQKITYMHYMQSVNNAEAMSDKALVHQTYMKVISGDITTHQQIDNLLLSGAKIAPQDATKLKKEIDSTDDGLMVKRMESGFYKNLDKSFATIKGVGGTTLPGVDAMKAEATMEIMDAKQKFVAQGGTARQFWSNTNMKDPASPYAMMAKHQISLPDMLNLQAQQLQNQVTGQGQNPNINRYSNSPTKEVPPPQSLNKADQSSPAKSLRNPGESIDAYSKRMGIK